MLSNILILEVFQTVIISEALTKAPARWFAYASVLVKSDLTGGMRSPFGGPKRLASRTAASPSQMSHWCLSSIDSFPQAIQLSWRVTHLVEETWQGARAYIRAAKRLLFLNTWRARPQRDLRLGNEGKSLCLIHNQGFYSPSHQLTLAGVWGGREGRREGGRREGGRKERWPSLKRSLYVKDNWLCLKDS